MSQDNMSDLEQAIEQRVNKMKSLLPQEYIGTTREAAILGQSVLHDTIGGNHPMMAEIVKAIDAGDISRLHAVCLGIINLYEQGMLKSPRLAIAREIEGDILDIAQEQIQAAESCNDENMKLLQLSVAAFLAGATIEDALRRLCDANGVEYDPQRSTISRLLAGLYRPSDNVEIVSRSENKQITSWADTRNKADHGNFSDITHTEVLTMVMGVRAFIDKHLPS